MFLLSLLLEQVFNHTRWQRKQVTFSKQLRNSRRWVETTKIALPTWSEERRDVLVLVERHLSWWVCSFIIWIETNLLDVVKASDVQLLLVLWLLAADLLRRRLLDSWQICHVLKSVDVASALRFRALWFWNSCFYQLLKQCLRSIPLDP